MPIKNALDEPRKARYTGDMETLERFQEKFGTEKQCLDYLTSLRWPEGYRCPRCHHSAAWQISDRKYKCKNCHYQTTVTAGTLFQDSHIPLVDWLKAAWYLTSTEERKTARDLQKLLGLGSNRTALLLMDKYALVWEKSVEHHLKGVVEVQTRKILIPRKNGNAVVSFIAAAELQGSKVGRLQMGILREKYYRSENDFVRETILPGSKLAGVRWNNSNLLFASKEYSRIAKRPDYTFKYAMKALDDLEHSIDTIRKQKSTIPRYIREYCSRHNRFKGTGDFEALVKAALKFNPAPYGKLPAR